MKVAVAKKQELKKCLEIREEVFVEEQKVKKEIEVDEFEKSSIHFLAFVEEKPIATGRLRIEKSFLNFERIAVLKKYRGQKVGKALIEAMEKYGQEKYPRYLFKISSQKPALNFYKKLGWIALGKVYMRANMEHQTMIKPPKDKNQLKCLQDPSCPTEIKEYLLKKEKKRGDVL